MYFVDSAARWLLTWERTADPTLLPAAVQSARTIAALCEGPCEVNVKWLARSELPTCAARLLARRFERDVYAQPDLSRLRGAAAALLRVLLDDNAAAATDHAPRLQRLLNVVQLRSHLASAHAECERLGAWFGWLSRPHEHELPAVAPAPFDWERMDEATTTSEGVTKGGGDDGAAATDSEGEGTEENDVKVIGRTGVATTPAARGVASPAVPLRLAVAEDDAYDTPAPWLQPGVDAAEQVFLLEGFELFALMSSLDALLPEHPRMVTFGLPNSLNIVTHSSAQGLAGDEASRLEAATFAAACSFFAERMGCVEVVDGKRLKRVHFALPLACLALPPSVRGQLACPTSAEAALARGWSRSGAVPFGQPDHLRRFSRRCRVLLKQIRYQHSLASFAALRWLSARMHSLLVLQGILALLLNAQLLWPASTRAPLSRDAPSGLNDREWLLRGAHLALSLLLASVHLVRVLRPVPMQALVALT